MKALVVDDEKLIVKGLKFSLEQEGYEVDCAYDGQEAVDKAKETEYDIVLLDLMLPILTGYEVCQQIREFSDMPIIMLTAKGDDMDKILGLEYGADDYILKPIKEEELLDALIRIRDLHFPKQQTTLQLHPQKYSGTVKTIISCVEMNLDQPELSLKQIADEVLFMSGNYLSKLFLKETGYKFSTFLTIKRMEKAAQLLRENCDVTVYEVAERTGFGNNPQYFSTVFKKYFGKSPSELREKCI